MRHRSSPSLFCSHHAQTKESGKRVEIFHYHYVWDGYLRSTWEEAKEHFEDIMVQPGADAAGGVGRAGGGDGTRFVTVLRDPVEHWLSYFYFYYEPEMKASPTSQHTQSTNRKGIQSPYFPSICVDTTTVVVLNRKFPVLVSHACVCPCGRCQDCHCRPPLRRALLNKVGRTEKSTLFDGPMICIIIQL